MKKTSEIVIFAALLAFAFIVPNLHAADDTAAGANRGERRKELRGAAVEKLGLSAEQQASLKSIREQERTELEALKADTTLTKEQKQARLQEIRSSYRAQADAVFTPEQKAKMQEFRANHPNLGKGREGRPGRAKRDAGTGG